MWVMVTGITQVEDALKAYSLGVDALGLLVGQVHASKSPFISPEVATSITKSLPSVCEGSPAFIVKDQQEYQSKFCSSRTNGLNLLPNPPRRIGSLCESVLVTHLTDVQKIIHLANIIGVKAIQLPGNTTPENIIDIKNGLPYIKVIKSLHVVDDSCIEQVKKYINIVDAIELDTIDIATDQIGGTGKTHDWNISRKFVQEYKYKVPIILAGGLHSDNVEKAIQTVQPFGVDVSSGVKNSESIQDNKKLASFIYRAKNVKCSAHDRQPDRYLMP